MLHCFTAQPLLAALELSLCLLLWYVDSALLNLYFQHPPQIGSAVNSQFAEKRIMKRAT